MEELPQKQNPEQLHTDEAPVQEPEYTLEEIMREFGGWTKREEEPAPKAPEPVEAAAQEGRPQDAAEPPPEQQAQALNPGGRFVALHADVSDSAQVNAAVQEALQQFVLNKEAILSFHI